MKPGLLLIGNFLGATRGTPSVSEELARQLTASGWPVLTTSTQPGRLARVSDMLMTVWRQRHAYQVAHIEVYSGAAFVWAELAGALLRWLGKPYVLTLHGGNLPAFARRWPTRIRHLLNKAAAVTTPSRYLFEQIKPYRADLHLLPNPLTLSAYSFTRRQRLRPRLIWLRAFHNIYNPTLAIRVLAALAREFQDVHLTMTGPDKGDGSLPALKREASRLGVRERLTLNAAVPKAEVATALAPHDIFLNTTNVDNTPVSVLEAFACGLCVVSTNAGGIPYLLEHEQDALLVPPNDDVAMTEAVRRLLTDSDLAARLSRQARNKAEQFDWPRILPQWETLLTNVAASHFEMYDERVAKAQL